MSPTAPRASLLCVLAFSSQALAAPWRRLGAPGWMAGRVFGVALLLAIGGGSARAQPAVSDGHVAVAHGMTMNVFDESGVKVARLEIREIFFESRRQGFFRVAWRPQLVFEGVTLDLRVSAGPVLQGRQLARALDSVACRAEFELREVRVLLPGDTECVLTAPLARLLIGGELRLPEGTATVGGKKMTGPQDLSLWLDGSQAGRWAPVAQPVRPSPFPRDHPPPLL